MQVTRWQKETPPSLDELWSSLVGEGLRVSAWTDSPGKVYPLCVHDYLEVCVILQGCLRIGLPETSEEIILGPGDRLDLPANTPHWADAIGHRPVVYLVGTKNVHSRFKPPKEQRRVPEYQLA
jgi:quercetin dioxygenase-like cupin family protein